MILPLRQRHRRIFILLAILLPVAFAAGIAARRPVPDSGSLPAELAVSRGRFESTEWQRADLFKKAPVQVRLLREQAESGRFAFGFTAAGDFIKPDLMVYWVAGNPGSTEALPKDAILLGAFDPETPLPLSDGIGGSAGVLVLYSLADGEIVDVSKPLVTSAATGN